MQPVDGSIELCIPTPQYCMYVIDVWLHAHIHADVCHVWVI